MNTLNSRQRILNAILRKPVDHPPLLLRFWSLGGEAENIPFNWRDEVARAEATLELGIDDTITLQPPLGYVEEYTPEDLPGVTSSVEMLPAEANERYPLLKKTYQTSAGSLQTVIRMTEDWPYGHDTRLFDDHNISRLKEPLIKSPADLPALECLLADPEAEQILQFEQHANELKKHSNRLGVALDGGWIALGDALMWLLGMEKVLYAQMDEPGFLDQILEILHNWEMKRIKRLLQAGVDEIVHMAWYETTDFWTPSSYRRLLKPRLAAEVAATHAAGVPYRYIITKSWKPYRNDLLEIGVDCISGVDPVQDTLDLLDVANQLGGKLCLMGGINSAVTLTQWSEDEIRQAVRKAMELLGKYDGFILYPVDAVFNTTPWENVLVLIDEWKKSWVIPGE